MGLLRKVRDWDASYDGGGQNISAGGGDVRNGSGGSRTVNQAQIVVTVLEVVAFLEAILGVLAGIAVGFIAGESIDGGGFDPVGFVVAVGALVNALLFWALAVGLACLDEIRRNTAPAAPR